MGFEERCRQQFEQRVIRVSDGSTVTQFSGHDGFVVAAACHPTASFGSDQTVKLWNRETGELVVSIFRRA